MTGPRLKASTIALALTAFLLLPACSARKPIPSDPPDMRSESSVRGRHAPLPHQDETPPVHPAAPTGPETGTVVSEVKDPQNTDAQIRTAEAKADAKTVETNAGLETTNDKPAVVTPEKALSEAEKAKDAKAGTKAVPGEQSEGKALEANPSPVAGPKDADAKTTATAKTTAEGTAQQNATQTAPRIIMVQIASFSTEKNASAALVWLKDKGYSEARVASVEQGQTVYHRVQAGPFQDLATARKALEELKADWPQAFIPAD